MVFDPFKNRESMGGTTCLLFTPIAYFAKERHYVGLAYGCLTSACDCILIGVNSVAIDLAHRAVQAADLCLEVNDDANYVPHWTLSTCHYNKAIASWILGDAIDSKSLTLATKELNNLYSQKKQTAIHRSDLEWGLSAYLLTGMHDNYIAYGQKYRMKSFDGSIKSDFMFGCALIEYSNASPQALKKKLVKYVQQRMNYFLNTGCYYHAMMLILLYVFATENKSLSVSEAVQRIYTAIGMQYPGEIVFEHDPEIVEFSRNR